MPTAMAAVMAMGMGMAGGPKGTRARPRKAGPIFERNRVGGGRSVLMFSELACYVERAHHVTMPNPCSQRELSNAPLGDGQFITVAGRVGISLPRSSVRIWPIP